ncbi:MAG: biopolymer transporter ExbD [Pseudomonadota bacterium]|jgi:biopolymer transport protein ExbD|nr:MAG: biopolymer transporter ExbD [Pseudomonadota bacterium]
MISRGYRARHRAGADELNITAFMNLMVVLVPFLLLSAVFSRLTILQLNLPGEATPSTQKPVLQLEVIVKPDGLLVADRARGRLNELPNKDGGYDYKGLNEYLQRVKSQFPQVTDATILLQPDTPYDIVVQTMDAVRSFTDTSTGAARMAELFPDISIGDAPVS